MRRGPAPKPAALKLVDGNTRKLGRKKFAAEIAAEPTPQRGFPECPPHLTGHARIGWDRLTENLLFMGLDAQVDALAIQAAATLYGRATDVDLALVGPEPMSDEERDRLEMISRRSWTLYRQYAGDLGANQAARARLGAARPKEVTDALDDAMFG